MILVQANDIRKAYGTDVILDGTSIVVQDRERVGLIGVNGAGKSTLLKIIAGEMTHDSGTVHIGRETTVGYLAQHSQIDSEATIWDEMVSVYADIKQLESKMRELEQKMAEPSVYENEKLFQQHSEQYARLTQEFTDQNGYAVDAKVRSILHGLDFPEPMHGRLVNSLSGGQKTRLLLGKHLLTQPNLLILDEPTNYLDIRTLTWLEDYLKNYPGALLMVSHDRYFLDSLITVIYEMERGRTRRWKGNYSDFLDQKAADLEQHMKRFDQQQAEIAKLEDFIQRNIARATTTKRAQSRRKLLDKIDRIDRPMLSTEQAHFSFNIDRQSGNEVLTVDNVALGYGEKVLSRNISLNVYRGERIALIGPNGIGKTTLLKAINQKLDPLAGRLKLGTNVSVGYFTQQQEDLTASKSILNEVWDAFPNLDLTRVRTVLGNFLFSGDDVTKPISSLSGGERSRVALAKLMLQNANFLILDEPTNHLDLLSKEVLENALDNYPGTLLFISHDRYFVNRLATRVVELSEDGVASYLGNYDDFVEKVEELAAEKREQEALLAASTKAKNSATDAPLDDAQARRQADKEQKRIEKKRLERLAKVEARIAELEELMAAIEADLCLPEVFSDHELAARKNDELLTAKTELDALLEEWAELEAAGE
ncbi:ABC-F family ATP-binding cassette domain-containing protein [Tumebacillus permanentifrigoris]|uniref:ATP-binding cassette subfamily F protein 3 n=1 Tax=Tumebacillus permanentifrigoris TaxID=378543 RepID=A0A316D842_9BACL|nr:ABC-F family ATP-binding cassette domain-containing protein [Tumebacillus permanentifrigoris]PWK09598.1 ATP-binding cassette subfamily F protein 3 [Tumebacillus permanentifrigoris]